MRLLYVSSSLLPSTEASGVNVLRMAAAFAKAGCDVTLCARGRPGSQDQDVFGHYGAAPGVTLLRPCLAAASRK